VTFRTGKKGDSVAAVAKRYGVSVQQVAQWNKVAPGAHFAANSTVVVYVAPKAGGKAAKKQTRPTRTASARQAPRLR
jgi:membrane-bound lytic murein transglycosylase D